MAEAGACVTVFRKTGGPLTKRISLVDGALRADGSACVMVEGEAEVVAAPTASALAHAIGSLDSAQALAIGVLRDGNAARVVTRRKLNGHAAPGVIARTAEAIFFRPQAPAWALIDFDAKGMPPSVRAKIGELGGVLAALATILPDLDRTARVVRASTSAGLQRSDTGETLLGSDGVHAYLLIREGADVPRFLRVLHERAWLAGLGWMMVGAGGHALERSIVDRMVGSAERLIFEGAPILERPLVQDAEARRPIATEGDALNTLAAVPPLTIVERARLDELRAAEKHRLAADVARARGDFIGRQAEKIASRTGATASAARRIAERHADGFLWPDIELPFDDPGLAGDTVAHVLADPVRYAGETLADPLEGPDYGRGVAKIMLRPDGTPWIHSFAHGRTIYELRFDAVAIRKAISAAPREDVVDSFVRMATAGDLKDDEIDGLIELVSRAAGVGKRAITKRLDAERDEKNAGAAKAEAERRAAERDDPRPRIEAPFPDAPWLPVMAALNAVLGASTALEPPFRDVEGCLCHVRERSIASLHLLTSASANGAPLPDDPPPAPPQPLITRLDEAAAAEMIERHIDFYKQNSEGEKIPVHLAGPFVRHFLKRTDEALPKATAVLTLPIVTLRGELLAGRGLDRRLGVVFRIPEPLMDALPDRTEIGPSRVAAAMSFLTGEWFADVQTGYQGKCVLIALALSVIERALFPERPAFFVTAAKRGSGKTTVVNMLTAGVLGRRAAAAGWSSDPEERRKAIFSYFGEGADILAWDNIALGTVVRCPSIEKALTAETYTDRILGVSEQRTVPATTIQIFTGNNIAPGGDMSSRSLIARLQADRPDPENREFRHADPISWTLANRPTILRALYVLLLGNTQLRTATAKPAETRFKAWWRLVGSAVEHAAAEHVAHVNALAMDAAPGCPPALVRFRDVFAASEIDDEQTSSLATVLDVCRREWPAGFTAADLANYLARLDPAAEALKSALEMAASKSIKIVSAPVLAWRLKAIVDAPCDVAGVVVALRYAPDHRGGTFAVRPCR